MSSTLDFEWTEHDYTLEGFLKAFANQLPVVIIVTEGWGGFPSTTFEYGAGEVYRICGIKKQSRVIARESGEKGLCFGIPLDYPVEFNLRRNDSKCYTEPLPLSQIVSDYLETTADRLYIFHADPRQDSRIRYWDGPEKESSVPMTELQLEHCYDEQYLLAHCVDDDGLIPVPDNSYYDQSPKHHRPRSGKEREIGSLSIPVYLPIKVAVATGLRNENPGEFQKVMYDLKMCTATWNIQRAVVNREILLYHEFDSSGNYDYITPQVFLHVDHNKMPEVYSNKSSGCSAIKKSREHSTQEKFSKESSSIDEREYLQPLLLGQAPNVSHVSDHLRFPDRPKLLPRSPICRRKGHQKLPAKVPILTSGAAKPQPTQATWKPLIARKPSQCEQPNLALAGKKIASVKPRISVSPATIQKQMSMLRPLSTAGRGSPVLEDRSDVPEDISSLTVHQLAACLKKLRMGHYGQRFVDQNIDGELLKSLSNEDELADMMEDMFLMKRFEAHKLWMFAQQGWTPKY